ncbi:hypothetical protein ALC60_05975 [Trachymyrmex zeteki]|uniref:SAP domain-containing protein n=1 Tax=Mycetomoellerius zeteki TaxID=64791 RepID=A0A151X3X7_9HYME|nr:PREDICTED: uncharacterized protein LOC108723067 [Trachymyrmex zeteki]KYQ55123.1 hypothetical protein ALC60_05975 [Trachymyrmex zeteki]
MSRNITVKELQQKLRSENLPVTGLKKELIGRWVTYLKHQYPSQIIKKSNNTNACTQEKSNCNLHKPLEDRRSGGAISVPRRDKGTRTKQRTERYRDWSERERDQPKTLRRRGQRDHSEVNCQTKYKDANNKYHFKYSKRRHISSEWYKKNEEIRNTYAREKPESDRSGLFRRTVKIETPARYNRCNRCGSYLSNVK